MNKKSFVYLWCSVFVLLLCCGHALAHNVTVFAWVEGDTVLGETKFSGGRKAKEAEIIVWDTAGNELLRTRTNEGGEFSFPIPKKCAMRIELIAGMGHKAEWTIPLEELGETAEPGSTPEPLAQAPEEKPDGVEKQAALPAVDRAELEAIIENAVGKTVEKALNKKITPLTKMVVDLEQKGPSFTEIVGGIGYIFGLMGIAMYFKSRQKGQ